MPYKRRNPPLICWYVRVRSCNIGCSPVASPGLVRGQLQHIHGLSDATRHAVCRCYLLLTRNQSVAMREVSAPILRMCVDRRGSFSSIRSWGRKQGSRERREHSPARPAVRRYPSPRIPRPRPRSPLPPYSPSHHDTLYNVKLPTIDTRAALAFICSCVSPAPPPVRTRQPPPVPTCSVFISTWQPCRPALSPVIPPHYSLAACGTPSHTHLQRPHPHVAALQASLPYVLSPTITTNVRHFPCTRTRCWRTCSVFISTWQPCRLAPKDAL